MTNARDEPLPSSPIHGEGCRSQGILGRLTLYNGELHFQFTFSRSGRTWCARTVRAIECIGSGGKDSCASGWLRSSATFPGDAPSAVQSNCSKREAYGRARAIRAGRRGKFPAVQPNNCTGSPRVNRKRSRCCLQPRLATPAGVSLSMAQSNAAHLFPGHGRAARHRSLAARILSVSSWKMGSCVAIRLKAVAAAALHLLDESGMPPIAVW